MPVIATRRVQKRGRETCVTDVGCLACCAEKLINPEQSRDFALFLPFVEVSFLVFDRV
jgi:hypothetical protein